MNKIIRVLTLGAMLALSWGSITSCKSQSKEKEQAESPAHILLRQAKELSRLELATTELRTNLTLDPKDDGIFGWKKIFGSRQTEVQLISQASVSCDFSLLTDSMVRSVNDSFVELVLPPLEVKREFESMHRTVKKEADPMRTPLSANEINKILEDRKDEIEALENKSLERALPELYRSAENSAVTHLIPLFQDLGLGMRVVLSPQDAALINRKVATKALK